MPLEDRKFNWEIEQAQIAIPGGVMDLLRTYTSIEISISAETMNAPAAMDPSDDVAKWAAPRIKRRTWSVDCQGVVDDQNAGTNAGVNNNMFEAAFIGDVSGDDGLIFSIVGAPQGGTNLTISGNCRAESGNVNYPGEASEMSLRLVGVGPLTVGVG